ncbi:LamG domain-containing protein [Streptomyces hydrogenans]|uniref:LamG domain-containing protein n=1 Tax=Streptomyces hydrogenans TaxID=1873719 RepID=UPI0036AADC75
MGRHDTAQAGTERSPLRRASLIALLTGALAVTSVLPASGSGVETTGPAQAGAVQEAPSEAMTEAQALASARAHDKQVEVLGLRTERREVFAAPDGTYTAREYTEPVHTVKNGKWVDVDRTLVERPDGTVGPKAVTVGLTFSGGEAGKPFVTMSSGSREMSLTWPYGKLAAPVLDGDSATYPDALPGVDLKVRAEADGFGHLLVVKTPEAAADPRLARLDLGLKTKGLTYKKDANGALTAEDSAVGGTVFQSGAPSMWDSAGSREEATGAQGPTASGEAPAARSATGAPAPALEGPGGGGKAAPLGIELAQGRMTLVPDQKLLREKSTVFPVVIDPIQKTADRSGWTAVMNGKPAIGEWQYAGSAGVGKCPTDYNPVSCNGVGVRRVMFQFPLSFYANKQILSANFAARVQHVYWADARAEPVQLYRVAGETARIDAGSNWNNTQTVTLTTLETLDQKIQPTSCESQANLNIKSAATGGLSNSIRTAATEGWSSIVLGLRAQDETTFGGWKRVCGNAYLSISYNTRPGLIGSGSMSSNPGGACVTGAGRPYTDVLPTLKVYANDDDDNDQVKVRFKVEWRDGSNVLRSYQYDTVTKAPTPTTPFTHVVQGTIPQNTVISWSAVAHDGDDWGPWSGKCEFMYDRTWPGAPTVTSARYPEDTIYHDGVGAAGTFAFKPNTTDSIVDTDVVKYRYSFDGEPFKDVANTTGGGSASVNWTPTRPGPHWVDVMAVDKAAHPSAVNRHGFYVSSGLATAAQWNLADEAGSKVAADEQGGNKGAVGPGVTFGVPGPAGIVDYAANFNGTEDSWIDADHSVIDTSKGFSVSLWARPTDLSRDMTVVSQDGTGEPGFVIGYDAAAKNWKFSVPSTDVESLGEWKAVGGTVSPIVNEWVLLTGVYDAATRKLQLYANKTLIGETVRRTTWRSFGAFQIGRHITKSGYENHYVGDLAEVRVFSRPLVATQIDGLAMARPARKGYWQMNDKASGAVPEFGGGQPMTLAGGADLYIVPPNDDFADSALVGTGHLVLDAAGEYGSTATPPVTGASSFTISARVRLSALDPTVSQTVFALPGRNTNRVQVRYQAATKQWQLAVGTADTAGAAVTTWTYDQVRPSNTVSQHLAVVYDAYAGQVRLYVNGQPAAKAIGDDLTTWAATGGLQVGRSSLGAAEYFAGAIDEVRAYGGALDRTAVVQLAGTGELTDR